jgi:hypothetical protein
MKTRDTVVKTTMTMIMGGPSSLAMVKECEAGLES